MRIAPSASAVRRAGSEALVMDLETLRMVAGGATILAGGLGVSLSTAVIGAMVEAVSPGAPSRVWAGTISALSVALRLFVLVGVGVVTFVMLAGVLAVSLARLVTSTVPTRTKVTGRHMYRGRGRGRVLRGAGRHRLA